MDEVNAKAFAALVIVTTALVGAIKKAFPKWTESKEELLAFTIPVVLIALLKLSGVFKGTEWLDATIYALGSGLGAQIAHDKWVNPFKKKTEVPK